MIGKLDEETGEIIPTGSRGRKKKEDAEGTKDPGTASVSEIIAKKDSEILKLELENKQLRKDLDSILEALARLTEKYQNR